MSVSNIGSSSNKILPMVWERKYCLIYPIF